MKNFHIFQEQIDFPLLNRIIHDNSKENNNIILPKLNSSVDSLLKNGRKRMSFNVKLTILSKLLLLKNNIKMKIKKFADNKQKEINNIITYLSIIILKYYINNKSHNKIQDYLKILLFFINNNLLKIENYVLILDILLKSILYLLKDLNEINYKLYQLQEEPLLLINDIIEVIINYPIDFRNNEKFVENLINLFKEFFLLSKKLNIFIIIDEFWLKLFKNKEFSQNLESNSEKNSLDKINNYLIGLYKNQIPKYFYNEIFKVSSIDLPYFLYISNFLKLLFKEENEIEVRNDIKIKNGIYIFNKELIYKYINLKKDDFTLVFSFRIKNIINEDISIFNLTKNDNTNESILYIIIDKEKNLLINFNKEQNLETHIKIDENKSYMLCITYNKKKKISRVYINNGKDYDNNNLKNTFYENSCSKYISKNIKCPECTENLIAKLGGKNYFGIFGEIVLINLELKENSIEYLFNSNDYYGNLISENNLKLDLIKNNIFFSKNCRAAMEHFKYFNYLDNDYFLKITPQYFFFSNDKKGNILEYEFVNSNIKFLKENGIDFLIFMLHNINSQIKDNKTFNLYLYKNIDFLYISIKNYLTIKNQILEDEFTSNNSYLEINENLLIKKINIYFLTLLYIIKNSKLIIKNGKFDKSLSNDVRKSLINFLTIKFNDCNIYIKIILSIIIDTELFDQRKYLFELNNLLLNHFDTTIINKEIIYKILLLDFIVESKNIKHKNYMNFLNSIFSSKYGKFFSKNLVKYIQNVNSDIKTYHYFKLILYNLDKFKKSLEEEDQEKYLLLSLIEKIFGTLDKNHCKYCSYTIILCYLIKEQIFSDKANNFIYNIYGYMTSPSFGFIRSIFIQIFKLTNKEKWTFIKSKNIYKMDFFNSIKKNPIEFCETEELLKRFGDLIKYFNFLFTLEKNANLDTIIENFFPFITEFLDKIKNKNFINDEYEDEIQNKVVAIFSSKEVTDFFILFLKYKKDLALNSIFRYIKSSLIFIFNPFFMNLLLPKIEYGSKKTTDDVKMKIIKAIILEMIIKQSRNSNIFYFLILIYKNIFEEKIEIVKDFPMMFVSLQILISDNKYLLDRRPLDLNFYLDEKKNPIREIKRDKNNNVKFISEVIFDIVLEFYFNNYNNNNQMLNLFFLDKSSSTIFYTNDIDNIINKRKKSINKKFNAPFFKGETKNISFCLYFLINFFNKLKSNQNLEKDKINKIKEYSNILFNDLMKIYKDNPKIVSGLKKIENYGPNFSIYNKMLSIFNKYYKDPNFSFEFLQEKYTSIINLNQNKEFNIFKKIGIEDFNEINTDKNNVNLQKYRIVKSKSFEKLVTSSMIEKYLENQNEEIEPRITFNNELENNLNKSVFINLPIKLNSSIKKDNINPYLEKNNFEAESYIKNELSKNGVNSYYNIIIKKIDESNIIKNILFNPKEYFLWKTFAIIFKDFIFNNKKFLKIKKLFEIHTRKIKVTYSSEKDKELFLKYPTKIKNYIINDYYRPFLKPCLNFYKMKNLEISHPYVKQNFLINPQFKEDNFYLIKFQRIYNEKKDKVFKCELIKNKGNIFGYLALNEDNMQFINSPGEDERESDDIEKQYKYIYSIKEDILIDKNKFILIFYKDIKEIFKRRICFNYIGYEIFVKNNRSYLFNFFGKEEIKKISSFLESKLKKNGENMKKSINNINANESKRKYSSNINYLATQKSNINNNKMSLDFKIIDDPIEEFDKMQYKSKYKKGEISNFKYLLLVNKYSSRSFNDYNQYLIFPLLFMDLSRKIERDLSKAICLNKSNNNNILNKYRINRITEGYHFNQHYSTGGYILYYLVRLIPFTYTLIDFQSGKFDLPARIFHSMKSFLYYFSITYDNRELSPEFFFNYEFLINLNYNDFGEIKIEDEHMYINNFDTNNNESPAKFLIYLRNLLEKKDISPWIDIIFGNKQLNFSDEQPNSFPLCSYESYSEFQKIENENIPFHQKIKELKDRIDILKFGITPAKLFNKPHPPHPKLEKHLIETEDENHENKSSNNKKENKIIKFIEEYLEKITKEKKEFYFINSKKLDYNKDYDIELIFKFNSKIKIIKFKSGEYKPIEESFKINDIINIEPYNNAFCEILPKFYCVGRNLDKTIHFISPKKTEVYLWTCIVTSIELFIQKSNIGENKNIKNIIFGDEKGFLNLLEIQLDFNHNDKSIEIKSVEIKQSIKAHRSFIKGILHNERLNIIISWSDEGVISINNDYSFNFLNIIDIGKNFEIKEILVSKYDLLIINHYDYNNLCYKVVCLTLNGLKVSECDNYEKIISCFVDEKFNVVQSNGNIFSNNLYDLFELNDTAFSDYITNYSEVKTLKIHIKYAAYYPKIKKYLLIYSNNKASFQDLPKNFI